MEMTLQTWPLRLISSYLRRSDLELGRWRLELFAIKSARKYGGLVGSRTVRTKDGFRLALKLNDWVDQHIYATGDYEKPTSRVIRALLCPGDYVVDGGANIGYFTLLASTAVGDSGTVLAFEPAVPVRRRLTENVQINQRTNVLIRPEALSDSAGSVTLNVGPTSHSGISSLRPICDAAETLLVETVCLDDIVDSSQKIALIKLDVEGAEHKAIRGMRQTIRHYHPDLIVEVSPSFLQEMGDDAQSLFNELRECGYRMLRIDWDGLVPVNHWHGELGDQFNALFTTKVDLPQELGLKQP